MFGFFKKVGNFFLDLVETVVIAFSIFIIIYLFLFQPHQVRGSSMYPSFFDKEYILTDKVSYRFGQPERGNVIIFRAPKNPTYDYIKRIICEPDEECKIENGKVYVNGQLLNESYLPSDTFTTGGNFARNGQKITVPVEHYFVLGDNRSHSSDSRDWGFVPKENIVGHAWIRYWPPNRAGIIKAPEY
mgnify:CR=1 FL=1